MIAHAALSVCIVFPVKVMTQGATRADLVHPNAYELFSMVDNGPVHTHREASDTDYRTPVADKLRQKRAKRRGSPSLREESHATNPAEK